MRNLNNLPFILIALLCVPALSSCGQKGPLKLPPSPSPSVPAPPPPPSQNTPPKLSQNLIDSTFIAFTEAGK